MLRDRSKSVMGKKTKKREEEMKVLAEKWEEERGDKAMIGREEGVVVKKKKNVREKWKFYYYRWVYLVELHPGFYYFFFFFLLGLCFVCFGNIRFNVPQAFLSCSFLFNLFN